MFLWLWVNINFYKIILLWGTFKCLLAGRTFKCWSTKACCRHSVPYSFPKSLTSDSKNQLLDNGFNWSSEQWLDSVCKMPWFVDNIVFLPGEFRICIPICAHLTVNKLALDWSQVSQVLCFSEKFQPHRQDQGKLADDAGSPLWSTNGDENLP